jgi:phenylalanyl-tRNA synthetase beta chain
LKSKPEAELGISRIRQHLVALGYQEVITYSFIDPEIAAISCPGETLIELQNPISAEMSVMRPSILPGLLSCLKYNENRQQDRIRLFESGLVFQSIDGEIRQQGRLAGLISGSKNPLNWNTNKDLSDFYDVKGDIESLFDLSGEGLSYSFSSAQFGCFHSGQCARVEKGGELVGYIGALHPAIQRKLGITENTYLFELALDQLNIKSIPVASKLSKYPEVSRDLAFVLDISTTSAQILDNVRANAGEYLSDLRIFDVYQGDAVAKDKKSIALGLTWQHPSRTLSDDDINAIISTCVNGLQDDFNANLRN